MRGLIDAAAAFVGLPSLHYRGLEYSPGVWLEGQILAESAGDPTARRYEAHQDRAGRRDTPTDPDTADRDDGELEDDASYGLMQVMGYNARRLVGVAPGTPLRFGFLSRPMLNMSLGLTILLAELATVRRQYPSASTSEHVERALCRYNGGPTGDAPTGLQGDYRLRRYVDRVMQHAELVRQDRALP